MSPLLSVFLIGIAGGVQHHRLGLRVTGTGLADSPVAAIPASSSSVPGVTGPVPLSPEAKEHAHSHVMTTRMTVITMVLYVGCVCVWCMRPLRASALPAMSS